MFQVLTAPLSGQQVLTSDSCPRVAHACFANARGRKSCSRDSTRPLRTGRQCHFSCRASAVFSEEQQAAQTHRKRPLRVMIAGAPAAGKGTQCVSIVEKYGLVHISAGDLLRGEVQAGTPAGQKAKQFMDEGNLVPNEVVVEMVVNRLKQSDAQAQGWLLDGYPRSAQQAEAIEAAGIRPDVFILIHVSDEELVERVVGRRLDPETGAIYHLTYNKPPSEIIHRLIQRSDDTEEKLRNRLQGHHHNVNAVVGYYTDELVEIDGSQSMKDVAAAIDEALANYQGRVAKESPEEQPSSII